MRSHINYLIHTGVKGMKWGVRKDDSLTYSGIKIKSDGSVNISKGSSVTRLVRPTNKKIGETTFAIINDYDAAKYIKFIGGKGFLGGGRTHILGLKAKNEIKVPSTKEILKINNDLLLSDKKYQYSTLGKHLSDKEITMLKNDPFGAFAKTSLFQANQNYSFDPEFFEDVTYGANLLKSTVMKKGYNALLDENDLSYNLSKTPLIIFDASKNLEVTNITTITDTIRKANNEQLKIYKKNGKEWVDKNVYTG